MKECIARTYSFIGEASPCPHPHPHPHPRPQLHPHLAVGNQLHCEVINLCWFLRNDQSSRMVRGFASLELVSFSHL